MLDLDDLLGSFGEDAPSGQALEYDPEFTKLELASRPGEEKAVGDAVVPAEEPDYADVTRAAMALLRRSKDLRVAVILANAALRTEGLPAFEETLRYIRRCLEDYWDSVHPQLDEDDGDDPTMRVNAVLGLTDRATVLGSLRTATLIDSRAFGEFGLRDLQVAEGEVTSPSDAETVPTQQIISAAFQDTDPENLTALARAVSQSLDHVKAISAIFDERIGALGPDLDPLRKTLHDIGRRLEPFTDTDTSETIDEPLAHDASQPAAPTTAAGSGSMGAISSPEDVKRTIDRIVDYYARHEPSSPVPLLLNRARRLVSADFVTIMRDMAPQGVENVALIGGIEETED